jgi:hypothetical protein
MSVVYSQYHNDPNTLPWDAEIEELLDMLLYVVGAATNKMQLNECDLLRISRNCFNIRKGAKGVVLNCVLLSSRSHCIADRGMEVKHKLMVTAGCSH